MRILEIGVERIKRSKQIVVAFKATCGLLIGLLLSP